MTQVYSKTRTCLYWKFFFIKSCLICNKLFRYCFVKADQKHNKLFGLYVLWKLFQLLLLGLCFVEVDQTKKIH